MNKDIERSIETTIGKYAPTSINILIPAPASEKHFFTKKEEDSGAQH